MLENIFSFLKFTFSRDKAFCLCIKNIVGFFPNNVEYYRKALIHRSASIVNSKGKIINNERLEYLGDAVLGLIVGDLLFRKFPDTDEGFLTQTRSKIVNRNTLYELTKQLEIQHLIKVSADQSISKKNIYGDALEAFIGAVYLDLGFQKTYKFVEEVIINKHLNLDKLIDSNSNYKSLLVEWAQKYKKQVNTYTEPEYEGSKYFVSVIRVEEQNIGEGMALSKKEAEQKAAKEALDYIKNNFTLS